MLKIQIIIARAPKVLLYTIINIHARELRLEGYSGQNMLVWVNYVLLILSFDPFQKSDLRTGLKSQSHPCRLFRFYPGFRVEALLGEKVEIRLLNAFYWVENPI